MAQKRTGLTLEELEREAATPAASPSPKKTGLTLEDLEREAATPAASPVSEKRKGLTLDELASQTGSSNQAEKLRQESDQIVGDLKWFGPGRNIREDEIDALAAEENLSPEEIQQVKRSLAFLAPGQGLAKEVGLDSLREGVLGTVGTASSFVGGPLQFAYKKMQSPRVERVMDTIQLLGDRRATITERAGPMLLGGQALSKVIPQTGSALKLGAVGSAQGAAEGLFGSRQGEELGGAVGGGLMGGVLGGAAGALSNALSRRAASKADEVASAPEVQAAKIANPNIDVQAVAAPRLAEYKQVDDVIEKYTFTPGARLSDAEADLVLQKYSPRLAADLVAPAQGGELNSTQQSVIDFFRKDYRRIAAKAENNAAVSQKMARGEAEAWERPVPMFDWEEALLSNPPKNAAEILQKYGKETAARQVIDDIAENFRQTFPGADVTEGRGVNPLRHMAGMSQDASGQGVEFISDEFRQYINDKHTRSVIGDLGLVDSNPTGLAGRISMFIEDPQYILNRIDDSKNTILSSSHRKLNKRYNQMSVPREVLRQQLTEIADTLKYGSKADQAALNAENIIRAIEETGRGKPDLLSQLTAPEQQAFAAFQKFFQGGIDVAEAAAKRDGLPRLGIKARQNYIRSQWADTEVLADRLSKRLADLVQRAGVQRIDQVSPAQLAKLAKEDPGVAETVRFMSQISEEAPQSGTQLRVAFNNVFNTSKGRVRMQDIASASMERMDTIPLWARETNLYKLADKWANSTMRALYLRQPIAEMKRQAEILRATKSIRDAEYVERLIQDQLGIRENTWGEFASRIQGKWLFKMDQAIAAAKNPVKRASLEAIRAVPGMTEYLLRQIYPNLLGAFSPRALIMNSTQTFTKTLPEFGGVYGASLFIRGAAGVKQIGKLFSDKELVARGVMPRQFVSGGKPYLAEGMLRSGAFRAGDKLLNKAADVGMFFYQGMETLNRNIAYNAGRTMASDLMQASGLNKRLAMRSLDKMPKNVRRDAMQALSAGDANKLEEVITQHIVDITQYQYNRASMSEMGRTMGPLFATFAKWPTATYGQIKYELQTKRLSDASLRLFTTMLAPLLTLQAADYVIAETYRGEGQLNPLAKEEGFSDRKAKIFSSGGLSQSSPVGNVMAIATGDFFIPPAFDTIIKITQAGEEASKGDSGKLETAISNALYMFAPGGVGGWIRLLTDDLVTLVDGRKPEGSNFFEKTASGWERLQ